MIIYVYRGFSFHIINYIHLPRSVLTATICLESVLLFMGASVALYTTPNSPAGTVEHAVISKITVLNNLTVSAIGKLVINRRYTLSNGF